MQHLLDKSQKKERQSIAHSLFQKQANSSVFQFVDNRPATAIQQGLFNQNIVQRQVIQFIKPKFGTPKYGDSAKLARERFKRGGGKKAKEVEFKIWKRGREAQHLIPAQVCRDYEVPKKWANSAINGMMLPSGRHRTNHLRMTSLDKGKMHHIKGGGSHPNYNKFAFKLAREQRWKKGKVTRLEFSRLATRLRKLNRPKRTGKAKGYIDDLR